MARKITSKAELDELMRDAGVDAASADKLRKAFDKPEGTPAGHGPAAPSKIPVTTL